MTSSVGEIVLFSLGGAILVAIILGAIIGRQIKKRREPDFKPVLNKKETIISLASFAVGVLVLVAGIFLPKLLSPSVEDGEVGEVGEIDPSDSGLTADSGSPDVQVFDSGGSGMVTEVAGGSTFIVTG